MEERAGIMRPIDHFAARVVPKLDYWQRRDAIAERLSEIERLSEEVQVLEDSPGAQ